MHEKQDDDHSLGAGNRKGHNRIEDSEILKRSKDRETSEDEQRSEDDPIHTRRDDVMIGVLRVHYIQRIMIFGHTLFLPVDAEAAIAA